METNKSRRGGGGVGGGGGGGGQGLGCCTEGGTTNLFSSWLKRPECFLLRHPGCLLVFCQLFRHPPSTDLAHIYSWLSLSGSRLSRITAYLEVEIWSLPKHENLTTGKKSIVKKRKNCSYFPQYFQDISNFKSPVTHIFVKCGCLNYFFLNSANLICRGTDISKYFRESLGIRDNESRLYFTADALPMLNWLATSCNVILRYLFTKTSTIVRVTASAGLPCPGVSLTLVLPSFNCETQL